MTRRDVREDTPNSRTTCYATNKVSHSSCWVLFECVCIPTRLSDRTRSKQSHWNSKTAWTRMIESPVRAQHTYARTLTQILYSFTHLSVEKQHISTTNRQEQENTNSSSCPHQTSLHTRSDTRKLSLRSLATVLPPLHSARQCTSHVSLTHN